MCWGGRGMRAPCTLPFAASLKLLFKKGFKCETHTYTHTPDLKVSRKRIKNFLSKPSTRLIKNSQKKKREREESKSQNNAYNINQFNKSSKCKIITTIK